MPYDTRIGRRLLGDSYTLSNPLPSVSPIRGPLAANQTAGWEQARIEDSHRHGKGYSPPRTVEIVK